MSEQKLTHQLNRLVEHDIPAEHVDLWPSIKLQVSATPHPAPRRRQSLRIAWALAPIALVLIVGFVLAPRLRSGNEYDVAAENFENWQDYGVLPIYQQGLQTEYPGLTKTLENTTVTLYWAYADPIRLMIAYQTTGSADITKVVDDTTGVELIRAVNAGGSDPANQRRIETFYVPDALMHAAELRVTVYFGYRTWSIMPDVTVTPIQIDPNRPDMIYITDVPFQITVPMSPSRIFEVNETVEAAGVPITLERLIVAPSASRADVCFDPPSTAEFPDWRIAMGSEDRGTLATGEFSIEERYGMFSVVDPIGWITRTPGRTCTGIWYLDDLPRDGDRYILTIKKMDGITPDARGTYTHLEGPWVWEVGD